MRPVKIRWKFMLASLAPVALSLALVGGMTLWIITELTASHEQTHTLLRIILFALAASFLLAVVISYLCARSLTRPLHQMREAAQRLARSESGKRIPITSRDELGELAAVLNQMVEDLEAKITTLSEERIQLTGLLNSMGEGVMVLDCHGIILMINKACEQMFQLKEQEIVGRVSLEVLHPSPVTELITTVLETRTCHSREMVIHTPTERYLQVHASVSPTCRDQAVCALLVFHDITEIRRLERVRKDFVANVSHELRIPLTSITGYVEALLDGATDNPQQRREFLQIIQKHTDRLNSIIADLLVLSQIESGQYQWKHEVVKIPDMIEKATALLMPMAEKKKLLVSVILSRDLHPLTGDMDKLTQVVINLLDNAIKYTPEGGKITVEAHQAGNGAEIIVSDTGVGIPKKDLPRIFERFFCVDRARSRELGGTGLGLSIVKHIVESHGGRVRVESSPGEGSRFTVSLPANELPR